MWLPAEAMKRPSRFDSQIKSQSSRSSRPRTAYSLGANTRYSGFDSRNADSSIRLHLDHETHVADEKPVTLTALHANSDALATYALPVPVSTALSTRRRAQSSRGIRVFTLAPLATSRAARTVDIDGTCLGNNCDR